MNRIIFLAMLLLGLTAKAQVGRVGINTASPEATLSIEVDPANALSTATSNEGVLIRCYNDLCERPYLYRDKSRSGRYYQ